MAYEFLIAMNSPGIVSHLRIAAATGTIGRTDNCEVTELKIESAVEEARRAAVPIPHRFQLRSKASI
jgi:hypothetical protein